MTSRHRCRADRKDDPPAVPGGDGAGHERSDVDAQMELAVDLFAPGAISPLLAEQAVGSEHSGNAADQSRSGAEVRQIARNRSASVSRWVRFMARKISRSEPCNEASWALK